MEKSAQRTACFLKVPRRLLPRIFALGTGKGSAPPPPSLLFPHHVIHLESKPWSRVNSITPPSPSYGSTEPSVASVDLLYGLDSKEGLSLTAARRWPLPPTASIDASRGVTEKIGLYSRGLSAVTISAYHWGGVTLLSRTALKIVTTFFLCTAAAIEGTFQTYKVASRRLWTAVRLKTLQFSLPYSEAVFQAPPYSDEKEYIICPKPFVST